MSVCTGLLLELTNSLVNCYSIREMACGFFPCVCGLFFLFVCFFNSRFNLGTNCFCVLANDSENQYNNKVL